MGTAAARAALIDGVVARLRAAGCVFAEDEAAILAAAAGETGRDLDALVERRCAGEPLEVVVGWTDFCGIRVAVDAGVFVPRHRSDLLVREAVARTTPGDIVVDLCCGSGALGAAIAVAVGGVDLVAADIDARAVACARRNVEPLGGHVVEGDMDGALPDRLRGRVAVLVANVPYVPSADVGLLPREARDHEPLQALDGGGDGLDLVRALLGLAPRWLRPGGHVLVEVSSAQAAAALEAARAAGLRPQLARDDDLEATVVIARLSPDEPSGGGSSR